MAVPTFHTVVVETQRFEPPTIPPVHGDRIAGRGIEESR